MAQYRGAKDDEFFAGNVRGESIPPYLSSLKTARLGEVALDIDGARLPHDYHPLFINRSEADEHDRIMMSRMKR